MRRKEVKRGRVKINGIKAQRNNKQFITDNKTPILQCTNYHVLNVPIDHIFVVSNNTIFVKPPLLKGNRSRRNPNKTCRYHHDVGHNTGTYYTLKDEIKRLVCEGSFRDFLEQD